MCRSRSGLSRTTSAVVVRRGQSRQRRASGQGRHEFHQQLHCGDGEGQGRALQRRAPGGTGQATPKFGMNRYMVLADTEEKALEIGRRAYRRWWTSFMPLWHKHNTAPNNVNYPPEIDGQIADGRASSRTPAKAPKMLRGTAWRNPARTIWSAVSPSAICRLSKSLRSLELFQRHVMPAIARKRLGRCRISAAGVTDEVAPTISCAGLPPRQRHPPAPRPPGATLASQPLQWVVGFPPGGGGDIVAQDHGGLAGGATRSARRHREQAGRQHQHLDSGRGQCAGRRHTLLFIAASAASTCRCSTICRSICNAISCRSRPDRFPSGDAGESKGAGSRPSRN